MMDGAPLKLDPDRFFPIERKARGLARALYGEICDVPIISPHGHTDPAWFARNAIFTNATEFLLVPDHYILRMLYSQGIALKDLGVTPVGGDKVADPREAWRTFAAHYYLFAGTPVRIWLDHSFAEVFGLDVRLNAQTADHYYDTINEKLASDEFRPRALLDKFNVDYLSTTEGALDDLAHHARLKKDGLNSRVTTTFRPDSITNPDSIGFDENLKTLAKITNKDTGNWSEFLDAIRDRRAFFRVHGASATDHGHPTPQTANLDTAECQKLLTACIDGTADSAQRELFRAQMLTEMAGMSREDGMVMQIHPGSLRNHNRDVFRQFGPDKGADIPTRVGYAEALKPLLDLHGNDADLSIILFTLDESNYARELAPLAGHYPCLKLGPAWWFHDSLEGMIRYRRQVTETAGFYNCAGFNDDTRALASIPARHDLARRVDCRFLAELACESIIDEDEAFSLATELTEGLVRRAYKLGEYANADDIAAE